ncbi:MAG TPA: molybdenum cofactor guanylyltransferase [Dehalococcoidia bacterium]
MDGAAGDVTGAVLAGGRSRRMGTDKARLELGGRPLLFYVLDALTTVADDLLVVGPRHRLPPLPPAVRAVEDRRPGRGPLEGIATALRESRGRWVLVAACDLPFLQPALLRELCDRAAGCDAVVPHVGGRHHLLIVLARHALPKVEGVLRQGETRVDRALAALDLRTLGEEAVRRVDPDLLSLFNVNTPEDLQQARALLQRGRAPQ